MFGISVAQASSIVGLSLFYASLTESAEIKIPIYLSATAENARGKAFVFELKEQIRQSTGMRLAITEDDAVRQILMVAMDVQNTDVVAYSVVWTWRQSDGIQAFEDMVVGICPIHQVAACARSIVGQTDEKLVAGAKIRADALKDTTGDRPKNP
jgi:hypothetical protein